MPKVRLTPTQLAVLRHADEKEGQVWRSRSSHDLYCSYDDANRGRRVNAIVEKLSDDGLLRIGSANPWSHPWLVTDFGREVLAEYDKEAK